MFSATSPFKHLLSQILTTAICLGGTVPIQNLVKFFPQGSTKFKRTNDNKCGSTQDWNQTLGFESWPWMYQLVNSIYLIFNPRFSHLDNTVDHIYHTIMRIRTRHRVRIYKFQLLSLSVTVLGCKRQNPPSQSKQKRNLLKDPGWLLDS